MRGEEMRKRKEIREEIKFDMKPYDDTPPPPPNPLIMLLSSHFAQPNRHRKVYRGIVVRQLDLKALAASVLETMAFKPI